MLKLVLQGGLNAVFALTTFVAPEGVVAKTAFNATIGAVKLLGIQEIKKSLPSGTPPDVRQLNGEITYPGYVFTISRLVATGHVYPVNSHAPVSFTGDPASHAALLEYIMRNPDAYQVGREGTGHGSPLSIRLLLHVIGDQEKDPVVEALRRRENDD
ncbi:hypothetical protein AB0K09_33725 [Streptomyces sp. NPDC049577]|uniref:hypothetical protein n=1 Tax=Streptomyces sp. NPDC049577 TaxID=3155153 RepID=UPI00341349FF